MERNLSSFCKNFGIFNIVTAGLATMSCINFSIGQEIKATPNIILILTDDQGWADFREPLDSAQREACGSYFETSAIDLMARNSIRFTNGYASAPVCTPSRRGIQFGLSTARAGGGFVTNFKPKGQITIPQALKLADKNIRCAHFGKWGETMSGDFIDFKNQTMQANPKWAGYDESDGQTGNETGFQLTNKKYTPGDTTCYPNADPKKIFSTTSKGIEFMRKQVREKHPFYLQLSYYAIHIHHQARQKTIDKYANIKGVDRAIPNGMLPMLDDLNDGIKQLMEAIDSLGIMGNTFIFFTSDNGGTSGFLTGTESGPNVKYERNHPLRGLKGSLYEGGIRVPFFVMGPGIKRNSYCAMPVIQYDLLPTFYDLVGGFKKLPSDLDGGSIKKQLFGDTTSQISRLTNGLVFHKPTDWFKANTLPVCSAYREGDFKILLNWVTPWEIKQTELYNLKTDIGEKNNLADKMPEKTAEMTRKLADYLIYVRAEKDGIGPK